MTRLSKPRVAGSDGSLSRRSSLGAMKRLIACHTLIRVNTVSLKQINKHEIVDFRLSYADIIPG